MAVNNLDLKVKKGSVTFLLGPNGSGKSTTLKLIAGMVSMDSGSRLELNEDAVVFGVCPQQNVSLYIPAMAAAADDDSRSFGGLSQSMNTSKCGGSSRQLLSLTAMTIAMTTWLANAT